MSAATNQNPQPVKQVPYCPNCDSLNIVGKTYAQWNTSGQYWKNDNPIFFGGFYCADCNREYADEGEIGWKAQTNPDLNRRRAAFIYEATRIEAIASQRPIVPEHFFERDEAFKTQFIETVARICGPNATPTTPEAEHESWMQAYIDMGWTYGPIRNTELKTHPDMVPFDELPKSERDKDKIFIALCEFAKQYITE